MKDTVIVRLYWDRDERAISATSEKYGRYCAAIAANILGDRADAEECSRRCWTSWQRSCPARRTWSKKLRRPCRFLL